MKPFRWTTEKMSSLGLLKSQGTSDVEAAKILGCKPDQVKTKVADIRNQAEIRLQERQQKAKKELQGTAPKGYNNRPVAALTVYGVGKKLVDLANHGECRFPVGGVFDKNVVFCAARSVDRGYCAAHAKICFNPVRPITSLPK